MFPVTTRLLLCALLLASFSGCKSLEKRAEEEKKADEIAKHADDAQDTAFVAFIGRLRKAVALRDIRTMSSMMKENFGYNWTPGTDGYGCFKYWDDNNLWPDLENVINSQFLPNKGFLVAPPQFFQDPNYQGFRAGIESKNGSYKFAYFVPAKGVPMPAAPTQGN